MRPTAYSWTTVGTVASNYANNRTGAGPWTMTNKTTSDGLSHLVQVRNDAVTNHSDKTITFIGTDFQGNPQTETITGPAGSQTVVGTKYFKTLETVTISASIGTDTFDIGCNVAAYSTVIPLDSKSPYPANIFVQVMSGTFQYNVKQTFEDLSKYKDSVLPLTIFSNITALSGVNVTAYGNSSVGATAVIIQQTGQVAQPPVNVYINQPVDNI